MVSLRLPSAMSCFLACATATAADIEAARDSPLVARYAGSSIAYYNVHDFDEVALLREPHNYGVLLDRNATNDRSGPEWLTLQGRLTEIRYEIPLGRSSFEVIANYEKALGASGFQILFRCSDKACLAGDVTDNYVLGLQLDPSNGVSTAYSDHARYLLAKVETAQANAHVAILVGEDKANTVAFVRVLEAKPIQNDKVATVNPDQMASAIQSSGKVDVYGILFDVDQATMKPESQPTLDSIAKLMADRPNLKLEVVGHTDGRGTETHNLELSRRRAASVVAALTGQYGIDARRLSSRGAGMSQPVGSNDTDEGRAQNRRVELKSN